MIWRALLLMLGVFNCATSVIMIKACTVHPVLLSSYRLAVAAVLLTPLFLRDLAANRARFPLAPGAGNGPVSAPAGGPEGQWRFGWRHVWRTVVPGAMLGAHFILWIAGARLTPAVNSSLIVNMVPVAMPFLLVVLVRERLTRGELAATALSLAGVAVLAGGDLQLSPEYFRGDVLCFVSMLLLACYLALGRRNRDFPSLWLYLVPLYWVGAAVCFAAALPFVSPLAVASWWDGLMVLGLGVVPTILGHSILNYSMKHFRGQAVGVAGLGQFIFAGILAYFLLREVPGWQFYVAGVLVVVGSILALRSSAGAGGSQTASTRPVGPLGDRTVR